MDARPAPSAEVAASQAPAPSAAGVAELPPLEGTWLEPLPLDPGRAFVCPPVGSREPRPVLVAAHGAGDRAEWACGGWRLASKGYPFVVCPEGQPVAGQRFAWSSAPALASAVTRALAALEQRYARRVAKSPPIFAGFSQGAILARPLLVDRPTRFPAAIFAEGGYATLTDPSFARAFRDAGGERVLVVCGGEHCLNVANRAQKILQRAGIDVLIGGDARAGHNLNERMQTALGRVWPNFVTGRPGWGGFVGEPHEGSRPPP